MACSSSGMRKLTSRNTNFLWTEDLQQEFEDLKNLIKQHVSLSPLDTSKPIVSISMQPRNREWVICYVNLEATTRDTEKQS